MKSVFKHSTLLFALILCAVGFANPVMGQSPAGSPLRQLVTTINKHIEKIGFEKVYLQTDKPAYNIGDTLWFKAYLLDAAYLTATTKSGILYVEIVGDSSRVVKRMMLPVYNGLTFGNIKLEADNMSQGAYTLIAYTNWMRNFSDSCFFRKSFYVSKTEGSDWLINYRTQATKTNDRKNVKLNLHLTELNQQPVRLREMQLRLNSGKKNLLKNNVETDLDGNLNVNFDLPGKVNTQQLNLSLTDLRKGQGNRRIPMPLPLNRPENIDLQFMPEGGYLVAGMPARIAFKAVNEDGFGTALNGDICDGSGQLISTFTTSYQGIGSFKFIPNANQNYQAKIRLPDGQFKTYNLPKVLSSGVVLQVTNAYQTDSCYITIRTTPDLVNNNKLYYLLGQSQGIMCYGASVVLDQPFLRVRVAKSIFPTGIVRFMLTASNNTVLNERLIYIDHSDQLNIKVIPNQPSYGQRDSVGVNVEVTDKNGNPVKGNFALSVTDDSQVKSDTLKQINLSNYVLLSSNLKGHIDYPGHYANPGSNLQKWLHTDELLLAQGWTGYDWTNAFKPELKWTYVPEQEYTINGRVTNAFNKPVANSGVTLMSKKPFLIADTVTNALGRFTFKGIYPADTAAFFIQARNKRGKSFNVGIEMDEFKPPVLNYQQLVMMPWYANVDTLQLKSVNRRVDLKVQQERILQGNVLKAVEVKAKKIIKGSKNLNGPGEADVTIDEEELIKAGRTNLGDLLAKRVKGFGVFSKKEFRYYGINFLVTHLIIDGIEIDFFADGTLSRELFYKQYLDYYDAEEIKGIEVMTSGKYQLNYSSRFINDPMSPFFDHTFIEVTTRGSQGPFMKKAVGTYVYRPMPYAIPKAFYTPKYKPGTVVDMTDIRSTIYWAPDVATDQNGKATVSFYTADNPGFYTITIEGCDMQGSVGTKTTTIKVKKRL
jgi:hypothetical protein